MHVISDNELNIVLNKRTNVSEDQQQFGQIGHNDIEMSRSIQWSEVFNVVLHTVKCEVFMPIK